MNAKQTKTIIMIAVMFLTLLVILKFAISSYVSLIIVMVATFFAGWYTSKEFWWEFSKAKFEAGISSVEKTVETKIEKASETVKSAVDEIKEQIEDATQPTAIKKIPTPIRKTPVKTPTSKSVSKK
jgi:hydrogenase/urease accessory protein HupE